MPTRLKNMPASVMARLKNLSKELNKPANLLLLLYTQERLLYRLSVSKYNDNFLLKGGLLLYSMTEVLMEGFCKRQYLKHFKEGEPL